MIVLPPLKYTCTPWLLQVFLKLSLSPLWYGTDGWISYFHFDSIKGPCRVFAGPMKNRSGVIYRFKCNRVECNDEYIGESSRTFGERLKEHLKAPSPIFDHFNTTGHQVSLENFSIVGREEQNLIRAIKEALYIRVNNPSLNMKHR